MTSEPSHGSAAESVATVEPDLLLDTVVADPAPDALGRTCGMALVGLGGHPVEIEAHLGSGLPGLHLVGSIDRSLSEAAHRMRAAVATIGLPLPPRKITVNLTPAALPKHGSGFDVAIAVAVLAASGDLDPGSARRTVHIGELGLDGRLRPVPGVLPLVQAAAEAGFTRVIVPTVSADEARLVHGIDVVGAAGIAEVVLLHGGEIEVEPTEPVRPRRRENRGRRRVLDMADVAGQVDARRALEVAAAGAHHLLMLGPPGSGKTMLASRLPGLLPDLDDDAAVEVSVVASVCGTFDPSAGLLRRPPFVDPHHTSSVAAVLGGGSGWARPGAISRAHRGVLFLDEAPEFDRRVLEAMREPLESGRVVLARAKGSLELPARFQLVLAANPCPCGWSIGKGSRCRCGSADQRRYAARLSGPVLDRVDIQVEVMPIAGAQVSDTSGAAEGSAAIAARVRVARERQRERWQGSGWRTNAEVPGPALRGTWRLPARTTAEVVRLLDTGDLTMRGFDRVLRIAWTLADLDQCDRPGAEHLGRALQLRRQGTAGALAGRESA